MFGHAVPGWEGERWVRRVGPDERQRHRARRGKSEAGNLSRRQEDCTYLRRSDAQSCLTFLFAVFVFYSAVQRTIICLGIIIITCNGAILGKVVVYMLGTSLYDSIESQKRLRNRASHQSYFTRSSALTNADEASALASMYIQT